MRTACRLFIGLIVFAPAASAFAADRSADEIVKDNTAIPQPKTSAEFMSGNTQRVELINELYNAPPNAARVASFLPMRWKALWQLNKGDEALAEIDKIIATTKVDSLK